MFQNSINASLPPALVAQLIAMLQQIASLLPFLLSLTPDERMKLASVSDRRLPYVRKATEYASNHRAKIGMSVENLTELKYYAQLFEDLTVLLHLVNDLKVGLRDTHMQAGAILYRLSRITHGQIELAYMHGKPGTEAMLDDLNKLFEGQGNFGDANDPAPNDDGDGPDNGPVTPTPPAN